MSTQESADPRPGPSVFADPEPVTDTEATGPVAAPIAEASVAPIVEPVRASIEVTCPGCGTASRFEELRRDADAFCRRCDYPLFWARGASSALTSDDGGEGLRRLPGTAGRQSEAAVPCRICREPNRPAAVVCIRCGADMAEPPPPAPQPAPAPAPAPPPEPEPEPAPASRWWLWLTIAGVVGVALLLWLLSLD